MKQAYEPGHMVVAYPLIFNFLSETSNSQWMLYLQFSVSFRQGIAIDLHVQLSSFDDRAIVTQIKAIFFFYICHVWEVAQKTHFIDVVKYIYQFLKLKRVKAYSGSWGDFLLKFGAGKYYIDLNFIRVG